MSTMRRVLFTGEAVTLAHVARTLSLAEALAPDHEVTVALAAAAHRHARPAGFRLVTVTSIPADSFVAALKRGRPIYDAPTLESYVADDLRLIDTYKPDLVVGDFRLSLSVSARLRSVPYLTVSNAYWSPWYRRPAPMPVLPWTGFVPLGIARTVFRIASGPAMAMHSRPLNRVRARFGLSNLGTDLRRVYTDADHVAYADLPELFPLPGAPANHRHIGPILWSPPDPTPEWWAQPVDGPSAYVSLGSSGDPALLPAIVAALDARGVTALVATAGAHFEPAPGSRARVATFLPGTEAAARTDFTICNGGSLGCQQALAAGKPVLGIASNMDQFLNMGAIEDAGAGLAMRADRIAQGTLAANLRLLLGSSDFAAAAARLSAIARRHSARALFRAMVAGILGTPPAGATADEKDPTGTDSRLRADLRAGLRAGLGDEATGA